MRRAFLRSLAGSLLAVPLFWAACELGAAPEEGADLSLPSSSDRYVPGLVTGKETEVDRRMEVTEKEVAPEPARSEQITKKAESAPAASGEEEGFFSSLLKNKTFLNLLILAGIGAVFIVYRLRSGGSSRR